MNNIQSNRALCDLKCALREVGVDVSDIHTIEQALAVLKDKCAAKANTPVNATLDAGPGVRIVPTGKKGYKISANSTATLDADLSPEMLRGTSIQKVLFNIIYNLIPAAKKEAALAPSIIKMDTIKTSYDGIDYYDNPAFGTQSSGRRSGLVANSWYLRVFTAQTKEPYYVDLGPALGDMRCEILAETRRMIEKYVMMEMEKHIMQFHKLDVPLPEDKDNSNNGSCPLPGDWGCGCSKPNPYRPGCGCDDKCPAPKPEPEHHDNCCCGCGKPVVDPNDLDGDGLCDVCGMRLHKKESTTTPKLGWDDIIDFDKLAGLYKKHEGSRDLTWEGLTDLPGLIKAEGEDYVE